MSKEKQNPNVVLDAITNDDKTYSKVTIHQPTIRRYAFLEKLKSPFIFSDISFDLENTIPSIYILAIENADIKKLSGKTVDEIKDIAFDWADENLEMNDLATIIKDVVAVFTTINDSAPQGIKEVSKKAEA